jgi:hypothetical protein
MSPLRHILCSVFSLLLLFSNQNIQAQNTFEPKFSSYIGVVHPIWTLQKSKVSTNFTDYYQMGITTGIILRKSPKYAYNLECVGFVRHEKGVSKMNNFLFHPGMTFYLKKGFTATPRLGFENNGRFGPSLIVGKSFKISKNHSIGVVVPNLLRFGNDAGASFTQAFHVFLGF